MPMLPHRDQDPILTLYAHYFLAAQLMLKNFDSLSARRMRRGKLSQSEDVDLAIYLFSWLGFLGVTCEGFRGLGVRILLNDRPDNFSDLVATADSLGRMIKKNSDELRKVRNNVFHLRRDNADIVAFFENGGKRIEWARELQSAFASFFSGYRISCEMHYMVSDRMDESQMARKRMLKTT